MSFKAIRRTNAILLVATLAVLASVAPSSAATLNRHRVADEPAPTAPLRSFLSFLLQLFEYAGGGMDPNGLK